MNHRLTAVAVALGLAVAACGSDGNAGRSDSASSTTPAAETSAPTPTEATTTTPTTDAPRTSPSPTATDPADPVPADTEPPTSPTSADLNDSADPATAAATAAWSTVFDSSIPFDEKAPFLADAEALRSTVEAYGAAGEGFGGIALPPSATEVSGTTATITYDVTFGANAAYSDQTGTIELIDGAWTVSRDEFCALMASARVPCQ